MSPLATLTSILLAGLGGCSPSTRGGEPPLEAMNAVEATTVVRDGVEEGPYVGVIIARDAIDLSAELEGTLHGTQLPIGTPIEAGRVLAQIDISSLEAEIEAAQAAQRARSAQLSQRQLEARDAHLQNVREATLADAGISPREEHERARLELEMARARRRMASAEVRESRAKLSNLETRKTRGQIIAPFGGKIASWYRGEGEFVQAGTRVIRITAVHRLWVRFAVPVEDLTRVHVGDRIEVLLQADEEQVSGTIRHLSPELDLASQMMLVEAELDTDFVDAPGLMAGRGCHVSMAGLSK